MARDRAKHTGLQETQAFQREYCHKLHMWLCLMGGNVLIAIDLPVWRCSQEDDTVTVTKMTVSWDAPATPSIIMKTHCPRTKIHCLTRALYAPALPALPSDCTSGSSYGWSCGALGPPRALSIHSAGIPSSGLRTTRMTY